MRRLSLKPLYTSLGRSLGKAMNGMNIDERIEYLKDYTGYIEQYHSNGRQNVGATRKTLFCVSSEEHAADLPHRRGGEDESFLVKREVTEFSIAM